MSEQQLRCLNCDFKAETEKDLLSHVRRVHQHQAGYRIKCCRCPQVSTNVKTHENHIKDCLKKTRQDFAKKEQNNCPPGPLDSDNPEETNATEIYFYWQCQTCNAQVNFNSAPRQIDRFKKVRDHIYDHAKKKVMSPCPVCAKNYKVR